MSYEWLSEKLRDRNWPMRFLFVSICLALPCATSNLGCGTQSSEPQFVSRVFVAPDGERHRYLVFLPRDFTRENHYPLLMFLNGAGEDGKDGFRQISNNFGYDVWRMRDAFPFVVVAPQHQKGRGWATTPGGGELSQTAAAMAILEEVACDYETDPDRVYLTGVSSGGHGIWELASACPDRFAAIVPMCGTGGSMTVLADANIPVWSFWNDGDPLSVDMRRNREQLIYLGRSPLATEYHGEGHNCWTRGYAHVGMYEWLLHQSRARNQREDQRFTLVPPEAVLDDWARRGSGTWTVSEDEVLVCRGAAPGEEGVVLGPAVFDNGEVHVDAKWTASATLSIALYDQIGDVPKLVFSVPYADAGIGGLWTEDEGQFVPLDPVVQRYLDADGWNDLRISKQDDVLSFTINGIPSLDYHSPKFSLQRYRVGLLSPCSADEQICWRYLRWRLPEDRHPAIAHDAPARDLVVGAHPRSSRSESVMAKADVDSTCEQIEAAWQLAESSLQAGELRWTLSADRFHRFGLYPLPSMSNSQEVTLLHRLVLDDSRWRYDGWQSSRIAMGVPPPPSTRSDQHKFFAALMNAQTLPRYKPARIVHCSTIWKDDLSKVPLWQKRGDEHSRVLIEPASAAEGGADSTPSSTQIRLEDVLLDAVLLPVRPMSASSLAPRLDRCELVEQPTANGWRDPWIVLSQQLAAEDDDELRGERRYWLDPGRNYAIRRVVETRSDKPAFQVDIHYDCSQTLPTAWYALALDENGDVSQFVRADRRGDWIEHSMELAAFDGELPADTWVVDRVGQQSYITKADGSRLELNGREYEPGASFAGLLTDDRPSWWVTLWARGGVRRFLRAWLTLPGILVSAFAFGGLGIVLSRFIRRRRAMNHASDAAAETIRGHV